MNLEALDISLLLDIAITIGIVILGGLGAYFKTNKVLQEKCTTFIAEAEELYKDTTKNGGLKFAWVVDRLYGIIPAPLRVIITRKMLETMVQNTFDSIQCYAKLQLDKLFNSYIDQEPKKGEVKPEITE